MIESRFTWRSWLTAGFLTIALASQHLDPYSRFCMNYKRFQQTDRQTDRQTDHTTTVAGAAIGRAGPSRLQYFLASFTQFMVSSLS